LYKQQTTLWPAILHSIPTAFNAPPCNLHAPRGAALPFALPPPPAPSPLHCLPSARQQQAGWDALSPLSARAARIRMLPALGTARHAGMWLSTSAQTLSARFSVLPPAISPTRPPPTISSLHAPKHLATRRAAGLLAAPGRWTRFASFLGHSHTAGHPTFCFFLCTHFAFCATDPHL